MRGLELRGRFPEDDTLRHDDTRDAAHGRQSHRRQQSTRKDMISNEETVIMWLHH